ncbi:unnamed protein product [Moneuplotes crassus]|uniref:Tubulin-tyrosine ligase family protein n=1 Tax=Euplotes crassus TaxID=5936 RepID=A0AAD1UJ91_EUPCR|nr:unnamed protein product [Moneuplotes crassus]
MKLKTNKNCPVIDFQCVICNGRAIEFPEVAEFMQDNFDNYSVSDELHGSNFLWLDEQKCLLKDKALYSQYEGVINRIYGMEIFKEKTLQYAILSQCKKHYPTEFSFHPSCYTLMKDVDLLQEDIEKSGYERTYICKPSIGACGEGMIIFNNIEDLPKTKEDHAFAIQHYIVNPLLYKNKKFDFRIFVIVQGVSPMRGYISFDTGYMKICAEDYDKNDLTNPFSNITNRGQNKLHPSFTPGPKEGEEDENAFYNKQSITKVWEMLKEDYFDGNCEDPDAKIDEIKQKIKDIANSLLRAFRSSIEVEQTEFMQMEDNQELNDRICNTLGLDIMLDEDFNPWLIETNRNPDMGLDNIQLNPDGTEERWLCQINANISYSLTNEIARMFIGKEESKEFVKCYDSSDPDSEDSKFLYERVFQIFKKISGTTLNKTISSDDFTTFLTTSPLYIEPSLISTLSLPPHLTLQALFNTLDQLSSDLDTDIFKLLSKIES